MTKIPFQIFQLRDFENLCLGNKRKEQIRDFAFLKENGMKAELHVLRHCVQPGTLQKNSQQGWYRPVTPAKHAEFLESLDRQNKGHIPILRCSCSSSFRNSFQYW